MAYFTGLGCCCCGHLRSLRGEEGVGTLGGGGVCTLTERWCLGVQFDLGHLIGEFTAVFCTAVYIPSHADSTLPRDELYDVIDQQEALHPKGASTVTGDFNKAKLKKALPMFSQHVDAPSLSHNILTSLRRIRKLRAR